MVLKYTKSENVMIPKGSTQGTVKPLSGVGINQALPAYNTPQDTANAADKIVSNNVSNIIDGSRLGGKSITVPPPTADSNSAGLLTQVEATNKTIDEQAKKTAEDQVKIDAGLKSNVDTGRQELYDLISGSKGETSRTSQAYSKEVDPAKKEVDAITAQINAKSLAYRRQTEKIRENKAGLFGGAVEQEVGRVERLAASELADLSIIQQAKLANYSTAKEIADRKVAAEMEQEKSKIEGLKFWYTENKGELTKQEDRQFNLMVNERERLLNEQTANKKEVNSLVIDALQNGAPQDLAQKAFGAKTLDEAVGMVGSYVGRLDRLQKIAAINKDNRANQPVTNPYAGDYSKAINVVLGSKNFTKQQKDDFINSINSGQDPFTVIKNQAKNIMGQTEATKITNYEVARDTLSDIGDQLAEFYANGGDTGLIKGNFEQVSSKLGQVTDPKLRTLATQIQGNLQVYRNAVSGTAYSEQEGRDIATIFPGINKSQNLNTAILSGRSKLFDSVIDSSYRTALGSVYNEMKDSQPANIPTPAQAKNQVNLVYSSGTPEVRTAIEGLLTKDYDDSDIIEYLKEKNLIQ